MKSTLNQKLQGSLKFSAPKPKLVLGAPYFYIRLNGHWKYGDREFGSAAAKGEATRFPTVAIAESTAVGENKHWNKSDRSQ